MLHWATLRSVNRVLVDAIDRNPQQQHSVALLRPRPHNAPVNRSPCLMPRSHPSPPPCYPMDTLRSTNSHRHHTPINPLSGPYKATGFAPPPVHLHRLAHPPSPLPCKEKIPFHLYSMVFRRPPLLALLVPFPLPQAPAEALSSARLQSSAFLPPSPSACCPSATSPSGPGPSWRPMMCGRQCLARQLVNQSVTWMWGTAAAAGAAGALRGMQ